VQAEYSTKNQYSTRNIGSKPIDFSHIMGTDYEKSMDYATHQPNESPMSGGAKSLNPLMQSLKYA
jgi:hypothetical protein